MRTHDRNNTEQWAEHLIELLVNTVENGSDLEIRGVRVRVRKEILKRVEAERKDALKTGEA